MKHKRVFADQALEILDAAKIALTVGERNHIEIADFGLGEFETTGLSVITYLNTERCCAKELVLLPRQTCPEHRHPPVEGAPGKEETFRCRWGIVYIYVEGDPSPSIKAHVPKGREDWYSARHQIVLTPGEQYTLMPNTLHWFQGGPVGAIVSEFSTKSRDESDIFTDPEIVR